MNKEIERKVLDTEWLGEREKKIICPTYDGLVRTLADAMRIDQEKLGSEPDKGFDHEDIISWVGLVDFKYGKRPNVLANLSSDQGKKVIKIDVQNQKEIESIDEKITKEEQIYSWALIEAKMKVVAEIAEEVYPAVAFQINDLRKEMAKGREEIWGNTDKKVSLRDIISVRSSRGAFLVLTLVAAASLLLQSSSCVEPTPSKTATLVSTGRPIVTEVAPGVMETKTATIEPTAVPTETMAPVEVKHPEFSRKYQPEYIDHHEVVVEGIKMNIDWGLSHWVIARPDNPIAEIHIAPDIAPILGEIFLKSCWYRFTHFMPGNESVSYEQYVELVKQGKGDVSFAGYDEMNGGPRPVEIMIDPAEGFAVSLVDESLPIKINDLLSIYYGSDGIGRLFIAEKLDTKIIQRMKNDYGSQGIDIVWLALFFELFQNGTTYIAGVENKCLLLENVMGTCGYVGAPPEWNDIIEKLTNENKKYLDGNREFIFDVVEK